MVDSATHDNLSHADKLIVSIAFDIHPTHKRRFPLSRWDRELLVWYLVNYMLIGWAFGLVWFQQPQQLNSPRKCNRSIEVHWFFVYVCLWWCALKRVRLVEINKLKCDTECYKGYTLTRTYPHMCEYILDTRTLFGWLRKWIYSTSTHSQPCENWITRRIKQVTGE